MLALLIKNNDIFSGSLLLPGKLNIKFGKVARPWWEKKYILPPGKVILIDTASFLITRRKLLETLVHFIQRIKETQPNQEGGGKKLIIFSPASTSAALHSDTVTSVQLDRVTASTSGKLLQNKVQWRRCCCVLTSINSLK